MVMTINCTEKMMKKGFTALKSGDLKEYRSIFIAEVKATEWAFDRKKGSLRAG